MHRPDLALRHELRFAALPAGGRIAWARSGEAGAPTLVRVAHWMTHVEHDLRSALWAPWLQGLGRRLQLVRYDEQGCGMSGGSGGAPDLQGWVEELSAVIDAHGSPQVALLGVSGAAPVAVAYAVQNPDRVSHLVLLGGYQRGLLQGLPRSDTLAYFEAQVRLVELGWGRPDPAVQEFFSSSFVPDAPLVVRRALNEQQRLSCDGQRAAAIMRARAALDVAALTVKVRQPTLVLHGEGDAVVPLERGRELAAAIPGARLQVLPTRNHLPVAPEPAFEQMCQAVTDFLAPAPALPRLTRRERELASLVARGMDNLQIAAHLGISDKTVRNALSTLYVKLGVAGRPQAVVRSRDLGL